MAEPVGLTNADIAATLQRYAGLLEIAGESPFRIRAYQRAAEAVRYYPEPVADLARAKRLREIDGVGEGIAAALAELIRTGEFRPLTELQATLPLSLLEIGRLPGVGPKTVARLHSELGITSIDELTAALETGRVRGLAGMGAKAEARLRESLRARVQPTGRYRLGTALPIARRFIELASAALPASALIGLAGSVRRWEDTVAGIDLVIATDNQQRDIDLLRHLPDVHDTVPLAGDTYRFLLHSGIAVNVVFTAPERFGTRLVERTGSRQHVAALGPLPTAATEAEAYHALGMEWIPPELRQGRDEIALARENQLPALVTVADIRGEFHCHTDWSDGSATIAEMTAAAVARGYQFLGISDHSGALGVAHGLDPARLRQQWEAIDQIRPLRPELTIYRSAEVEVRHDGRLDFSDDILAELDIVIASLHVGLRQPQPVLMERLIRTLKNPNVDIIAHPSGRIVEARAGGDFDWPEAFATAARTGTALEINADPSRLDLTSDNARAALAAGCLLTINCDAHGSSGFDSLEYGVHTARRAGATADRILNCWPVDRIDAWRKRRG